MWIKSDSRIVFWLSKYLGSTYFDNVNHCVCHEADGIFILFYFPFWALISQPFQTLHCISMSLMFSCTQLCTVTEFMLLSFPTLCNFIVDYVLQSIVCHCICNRLCPDFTSLIFTLIFPTGIYNGMECKALHFTSWRSVIFASRGFLLMPSK